MFLVILYEVHTGYSIDSRTKVFDDEKCAKEYAHKLNEELATKCKCNMEDLLYYYRYGEIEKG